MNEAGELEIEELDTTVVEQHDVAVVGVVVAENRFTVGKALHRHGERVGMMDGIELVAQGLF